MVKQHSMIGATGFSGGFSALFTATGAALCLAASPAQATCLRLQETMLPAAQIVLTPPRGAAIARMTGTDGELVLRKLRRGEWRVRLADDEQPLTMRVERDRRLVIRSVVVRYSCSAPGGPASHSEYRSLRQLNRPAKAQP